MSPGYKLSENVWPNAGTLSHVWMAVSGNKHQATAITQNWDDKICYAPLEHITDTLAGAQQLYPAHEEWCMDTMDTKELDMWVDAKGAIIKDAYWLWLIKNTQHINMSELDVVLRRVNLMLKWQATILHMNTDSLCLYSWTTNALTGESLLNTKSTSEMLIR